MSSYQNGDKHMRGLGWNKSTKLSRLFEKLDLQAEDHADFVINTHRMEGDFVPIINRNKEKVKAKAKGRKINYFADDEYFTIYLFFGEEDKIAADLKDIPPPPPEPADTRKINEDLIKSVNMPNFIVHTGSLSDAIKKGKVWASDREPPEYRVTVGTWRIIVQPETGAGILNHRNLSWCKHDELVALVGLVSSGRLKELDPAKHIRYKLYMYQPSTKIYLSLYNLRLSQVMLVVKNGIKAVKYPKKYEKEMKEALERGTSLTISLRLCMICKIPD